MSWVSRSNVLLALTGGVALVLLAAFGGGLPALAGEARSNAAAATNASWRAFAADLASASGCVVHYEAPIQGVRADGEPVPSWAAELGGIGMLRVGASDGPSVLVMPENLLGSGGIASAYANVGLKEPRRFAQELVASATFGIADEAKGSSLSELLRDSSVLIPVVLQHGARHRRFDASSVGSPRRNFPVRWEEAAAAAPVAAGPYPASHPSVRALTSWFHGATDCAGLVMVRGKKPSTKPNASFESGSLEAFCDEVLMLKVEESTEQGCGVAIQDALQSAPRLAFKDPLWTRLGSANWSLEITVERHGGGKATGEAVLLAATPVGGAVALTAAAASRGTDTLELLPLRSRGVLLEDMAPGASRRMRLFFTEAPQEDGLGRREPGTSGGATHPTVDLEATAPRARKALMRSQSPV